MNRLWMMWLLISCALIAQARETNPSKDDIDQANQRIQNVMDRVSPGVVFVPTLDGEKANIPVQPMSGVNMPALEANQQHIDKTRSDPMLVAKKYNEKLKKIHLTQDNQGVLLIFASFSMPEESLKRLALESRKSGALIVFRGFHNGSLKQTQIKSSFMNKLGARLQINPELFTQYAIEKVPVTIIAKQSLMGCASDGLCSNYFGMGGDMPLAWQLEKIEEKARAAGDDDLQEACLARLARLQGVKP